MGAWTWLLHFQLGRGISEIGGIFLVLVSRKWCTDGPVTVMPGEHSVPLLPSLCRQRHQLLWRCQRTHFNLLGPFRRPDTYPLLPAQLQTPPGPRKCSDEATGHCWPLACSFHPQHIYVVLFSLPLHLLVWCLTSRPASSFPGLCIWCLSSS